MKQRRFSIEVTALSPLAIRSDHALGGTETAKYISGATLLGGLANVHRLLYGEKEKQFAELFLQGQIRYPHLYPAGFDGEKRKPDSHDEKRQADEDGQIHWLPEVYPLPKTAQSCKRFTGFLSSPKKRNEERHGVRDTLLDWAAFKLSIQAGQRPADALQFLKQHELCIHNVSKEPATEKQCDLLMDSFHGYYRLSETGNRVSTSVESQLRLQTRTGISRESGIVEEAILYNREVFVEGTRFWGMIQVPDALASQFESFAPEISAEELVRIGTGRTRGLGKVNLKIQQMQAEEQKTSIENEAQRFDAFQKRVETFHKTLSRQAAELGLPEHFYFALTLHSPLILCDPLMRYRGTIDEKTLNEAIHLPASTSTTFKQLYQAASIQRTTGWLELWGTPRTNEYAIETGSVFLFAASTNAKDSLVRALFELEEQGMGQRRAEGFGRVYVSDPFHHDGELH